VPYSESPRNKSVSAPILINIGLNLTCFGPGQSFDLLGWGDHSQKLLILLRLLLLLVYYTIICNEPKCSLIYSVDRSTSTRTSTRTSTGASASACTSASISFGTVLVLSTKH
jgi:hypothetical protein